MLVILNLLTEISIIKEESPNLPQIRIDDVEAERCRNVAAIVAANVAPIVAPIVAANVAAIVSAIVAICAPHYNMHIRDMCSV
jgi:hypothetical protein